MQEISLSQTLCVPCRIRRCRADARAGTRARVCVCECDKLDCKTVSRAAMRAVVRWLTEGGSTTRLGLAVVCAALRERGSVSQANPTVPKSPSSALETLYLSSVGCAAGRRGGAARGERRSRPTNKCDRQTNRRPEGECIALNSVYSLPPYSQAATFARGKSSARQSRPAASAFWRKKKAATRPEAPH